MTAPARQQTRRALEYSLPPGVRMILPFHTTDNYTSISNDMIDYIMPKLKPNAWKVLCFIIRKTHGWHKEQDDLPYSQIGKGTGIGSSATISAALKELEAKNLVIRTHGGKWDTVSYRLNLDYEIVTTDEALASETKAKKRNKKTALETEVASETKDDTASEIEATPLQKLKTQKKEDTAKDMSVARKARTPRAPAKEKPFDQSRLNGFDPNVQVVKEAFGKQTKLTPAQIDLIVDRNLDTACWRRNVIAYAQKYSRVNVPAMLDWYARDEAGKQLTQQHVNGTHTGDYSALKKLRRDAEEYDRYEREQQQGGQR